jgi:uncharacterized protein (TIGR00725 family)
MRMPEMRDRSRRPVIGVMGAGGCDEATAAGAEEVGRLVAESGAVLLCGGRGGVMEAAARGAKQAGGLTVGILPGRNARETAPNSYIDVAIFTGMGDGRNWINACSSDAIVAVAGGYGTLSEIALALKLGKPVVLLGTWSFARDETHAGPMVARTAAEAVAMALDALR